MSFSNDEVARASMYSQKFAPGRGVTRLGNMAVHKGGKSASHMMAKMGSPQGFDKYWQNELPETAGPRPPGGGGNFSPQPPKSNQGPQHVHDFFGKYSKTMKNQIRAHQAVYGEQ